MCIVCLYIICILYVVYILYIYIYVRRCSCIVYSVYCMLYIVYCILYAYNLIISADPSNLQGERAREKVFPGFWALSKSFSSGFRKQR